EDGELGEAGAQRERRADALVHPRRGEPHIEDAQVRRGLVDRLVEVRRVRKGRDDLMAGVLEDAHQAFPQQRGILADQDAHGMLTSTVVGPPTGLSMRASPPAAMTRLTMPSRPPPGMTRAPPTPLSSTRAHSAPGSRRRTTRRTSVARECLVALVSASAIAKYAAASVSRLHRP